MFEGGLLARTIMVTAVYLVIAWVLMVSYQIFTQPALITVSTSLGGSVPLVASWMNSGMPLAVFVFSFAWMFVLSSIISKLMFGKERRITIQFLVILALTLMGSFLLGMLSEVGLDISNPSFFSSPFTQLFGNVFFAVFYLALPFIVMLVLDLRNMRK